MLEMKKLFTRKDKIRMRIASLSILFVFASTNMEAQQKITGFISSTDNLALQYVSIALKQDSILMKSTLSDSLGQFEIVRANDKPCSLLLYFIGYHKKEIGIGSSTDTVLHIRLEPNEENTLNEVSVMVSIPTIERKPDRLIFNVTNNATLLGANAIEVLRKTPLVTVGNTSIGIIGKSQARIMINDRLVQLAGDDLYNYLKSIPANSIQCVEVITNPSAKYDASGNAGIIHIKTIKNKQEGIVGNIQTVYEQRYYGTEEVGGSLSVNHKQSAIWLNANYRNGTSRPVEKMNAHYPLQNTIQTVYRPYRENRLSLQAGMEQRINQSNILEFSCTGLFSRPSELAHGTTLIYAPTKMLDSVLESRNTIYERIHSSDFNFNYKHNFDTTGKKITLNTDYFSYANIKNQNLTTWNTSDLIAPFPGSATANKSKAVQGIGIFTAAVDYEHPLKNGTLNIGVKETYLKTDNNYNFYKTFGDTVYINDATKSNHFLYKEDTKAVYISSSFSKWTVDIQLGLRGEYTRLTGNSINLNQVTKADYFRVFPTVYIQKAFNQNHVVSITYGRRINRPDYESLNPFRYYVNAYQYSEGNPNLTPSLGNNFELNYTLKGKYIFGIFEQYTTNLFQQVPIIDPATQWIVYTRKNTGQSGSTGVYAVIPFKLNWFESSNTISAFTLSQKAKYNAVDFSYNSPSFMFSSYNQFVLNNEKTFFGELTFQYVAPSRNFIYDLSEFYSIDAGVKFNLLNKKLTIGLSCSDIFFTNNPVAISTESSQVTPFSITILNDSRMVRLSCSYKFGGGKAHDKKEKSNSAETERIK